MLHKKKHKCSKAYQKRHLLTGLLGVTDGSHLAREEGLDYLGTLYLFVLMECPVRLFEKGVI